VQPEERGRVTRPQYSPEGAGPTPRGEMKQEKPEKKTKRAEPERDRGSRDEGRHEER
jgi:hypothetical protein